MAVNDDRTDVEHPAGAGHAAGLEQIACCIDNAFLKRLPRSPVTDARRTVVDDIGPRDCLRQRSGRTQISGNEFDAERAEERSVAVGAHESTDALAPGYELFGDVTTEQARRT